MPDNRARSIFRLLRGWLRRRWVQLGLALRVTVTAMLALALAQLAELRLPLWAVLTAVVVTQVSVGKSLKAAVDYLIGTLGGALYGGVLAVFVPHANEVALLAVLGIAVAPLALIAAINPRLTVAPITAIIVLLVPAITHVTPLASATDRVLEVALGAVTGIVVSFLLVPAPAHAQLAEAAARTLDQMGRTLRALLSGLSRGLDMATLHRLQDVIGHSLVGLSSAGREAEHERAAHIAVMPDTGPLLRTMTRLRHDLVMIGRAALAPLPEAIQPRLELPLHRIADAAAEFLAGSGAALRARRIPPPLDGVEAALDAYATASAQLRSERLTSQLPAEAAERFFAVGFALEQLRHNLTDLERCVGEWAEQPRGADRSVAADAAD